MEEQSGRGLAESALPVMMMAGPPWLFWVEKDSVVADLCSRKHFELANQMMV